VRFLFEEGSNAKRPRKKVGCFLSRAESRATCAGDDVPVVCWIQESTDENASRLGPEKGQPKPLIQKFDEDENRNNARRG
jgi:hypothetical protein